MSPAPSNAAGTVEKTEALVLRVQPWSSTSHIVTWLTPGEGRLVTLAKGVQRPKSRLLGQFDLFYSCELLYYARDRQGVHILRECTALDPRPRLRIDWRASACAAYACHLVSRVALDHTHDPALYGLTEALLDHLAGVGASFPLVYWFELRLTELLGWAPQLQSCPACGQPHPASGGGPRPFALARGALLCPRCTRATDGATLTLTPDVQAMLRAWQSAPAPRGPSQTRCTRTQARAAGLFLGAFLDYHLDISPTPRYIALDMLAA